MNNEIFKVSGIGLDTSNLVSADLPKDTFKYIFTSISENNEFLVKPGISEDTVIVTQANFLDKLGISLQLHMRELGRKKPIDLLVIPCSLDYSRYSISLRDLVIDEYVNNIGLAFPESLDKLKTSIDKLKEIGVEVKYITLEICPYHFDYQLLQWCKDNEIKVFGFNPFGGNRSAACMIESFTAPYLLGFISAHSDVVFLSSRNTDYAISEKEYIETLFGKEVTPKYILRKNVNKLIKSLGNLITCDILFNDIAIPLDMPNYLFPSDNLKINFGSGDKRKLDDECFSFDTTFIEDKIYDTYLEEAKPEDGDSLAFLSILRPRIKSKLLDLGYTQVDMCKLGKRVFMFSCVKETTIKPHWYSLKKTEYDMKTYILYYHENRFFFREYKENTPYNDKNANEKD